MEWKYGEKESDGLYWNRCAGRQRQVPLANLSPEANISVGFVCGPPLLPPILVSLLPFGSDADAILLAYLQGQFLILKGILSKVFPGRPPSGRTRGGGGFLSHSSSPLLSNGTARFISVPPQCP